MAYQQPTTMAELRQYVTGQDGGMQNRGASTILLHVEHSNLTRSAFPEIRLDLHMTVGALKEKLYTHTGTQPVNQRLQLRDSAGAVKGAMDGDDRKLGYFSPEEGDIIYIQDMDPFSASAKGWLEDTSLVEKYEMTDEDYDKRDNSVRAFKRQQAALKKAEQGDTPVDPELMKDLAEKIEAGNRCEVFPGGRRATVRYVGKAEALGPGWWIGVEYDDPVGKHDGTVKGVKFFECGAGFGGVVRPDKVTVGDFPSLDDELALSDDEL